MKKGFTLIELLIAVAILAVLSVMGLGIFASAQRRGRDARRKGDMRAIQRAFEQYYSENMAYPASCGFGSTMEIATGETFLVPSDPVDSGDTQYSGDCTVDGYCVCAYLESEKGGNASDGDCDSFSSDGAYFCVENLQ